MSSGASSTSGILDDSTTFPLLALDPPDQSKKDWVKIGSIVAMVAGGIITALAALCIMGNLPIGLFGPPPFGVGITLIVGLTILLPAALVFFDRKKQ